MKQLKLDEIYYKLEAKVSILIQNHINQVDSKTESLKRKIHHEHSLKSGRFCKELHRLSLEIIADICKSCWDEMFSYFKLNGDEVKSSDINYLLNKFIKNAVDEIECKQNETISEVLKDERRTNSIIKELNFTRETSRLVTQLSYDFEKQSLPLESIRVSKISNNIAYGAFLIAGIALVVSVLVAVFK